MRALKIILGVLFVLGLVAAFIVASLPKPPQVETVAVARGYLAATVDGDGRTRVKDRHTITAPLYGNLARIELQAGDEVKVGQTIARISPLRAPLLDARSRSELEARVKVASAARRQAVAAAARAKEASDYANREFDRAQQLGRGGNISAGALDAAGMDRLHAAKQLESARFGVQVADHELEMAKAALGQAETDPAASDATASFDIRSPIDGQVLRIVRDNEGVVNPGEALVEVADPEALEIVVDVLTQDALEIEEGAQVRVERWGGPSPLSAHVRRVEPSAFTKISALGVEEQRVNVVIDFDEHVQVPRSLGDGFHVDVAITVWDSEDAVSVPLGALHRRGARWAAFVVEDNVVTEREVEAGHRCGVDMEIVEGLQPGEAVILHPSEQIREGVEVEPRAGS